MEMKQILALIGQPAFLTQNDVLCWCNPAAQQLVREGTALSALLEDGGMLLALWNRAGCLQLPLLLGGMEYDATACATAEGMLFVVNTPPRSRSDVADVMLSLSAHLRRLLQDMMNASRSLFDSMDSTAESAELNRALYRLLRLCNQYADGGQLLDGSRAAHFRPVELQAFFDSLVEAVLPLVKQTGRVLHYTPLGACVRSDLDAALMERAMYNLLDNALRYTPRGGEIFLRVERHEQSVLVELRDTGEGMRPELLANLFERYETPLGDGRRGAGLGLPIVREIVRLHHGSLTVTSDETGTTARFSLPLLTAPLLLRSPMLDFDTCAGLNHALVELSDSLPDSLYDPEEVL